MPDGDTTARPRRAPRVRHGKPTTTPGAFADRPTRIPWSGWRQIAVRAWKEGREDNVGMLASAVAFAAFLALFPSLIAGLTIYGLVTDPEKAQRQVQGLVDTLPAASQDLILRQVEQVTSRSAGALTIGLVLSVLGALWSASGGVNSLVKAVNIAYDENDDRGFIRSRGLALALTVGAMVFVLLALTLVAVVPALFRAAGLGTAATVAAEVARWLLVIVLVLGALGVVYRLGPDRTSPRARWVSPGALLATAVWVVASAGFSWYASNFSSYSGTYGALTGVIVLLLWLHWTCYIVLFGAEINAEAERQTRADTTVGEPKPIGRRGAIVADHGPDTDPPAPYPDPHDEAADPATRPAP